MSIENNFAGSVANISGGFSGGILGQANRIATLQNNGIAAHGSPPSGITVEGAIAMLQQDPSLTPLALRALQDPSILRQTLATLQQKPELVQALPLEVKQFLHYVLSNGTGRL